MYTGLMKIVEPKGVSITVNLTNWKEIAHSLRILANTFEHYNERGHSFGIGSVGRVESADGSSCGGWVTVEGK